MDKMQFLKKKTVKEILNIVEKQWGLKKGCGDKLDFIFLMNSKNKLFIINKEIVNVDFDMLRIDSMGLYLGEVKDLTSKNGELRLSIEGSQIIGPLATKNVVEISDGLKKLWIRGFDIEVKNINDDETKSTEQINNVYVLLKNENDFLGCGKFSNGKIYNLIPKSRRVTSED